jgi:hypothetical protein
VTAAACGDRPASSFTADAGFDPEPRRLEATDMSNEGTFVAIYPRHILAEEAVVSLRRSGVETGNASIVGRGYDPADAGAGTQARPGSWERTGAFWGGIWEAGAATFFLPELGILVVAGPLARWVLGALESGFLYDGLTPVGVALHAVGVPTESARRYEREIRDNRCLLVFPCTNQDALEVARRIRETRPRALLVHEPEPAAAHG